MVMYMKMHGMMAASAAPSSTRTATSWLNPVTKAVPMVRADQLMHEPVISSFGLEAKINFTLQQSSGYT
jgi:hypothetical protein